jgi:acyl-CoA synthetase (AMP-forming)/AMP-acid ligase II
MHLFASFVTRAECTPDRSFCHLLCAGAEESVSHGTIYAEAAALAASLTSRGIRPGQIVPIVLEHRRELFSSFIGCSLAGAAPAFLPPLTRKQDPAVFRASMAALLARIDPPLVIGSAATLISLDLAGRVGLDIEVARFLATAFRFH